MAQQQMVRGSITKTALAKFREEESKDLADLVESMDQDYQVKLAGLVLLSNARAARFSSEVNAPAQMSPLDAKRSELLGDQFLSLFKKNISKQLEAVRYGRVAFEKIFAYEPITGTNFIRKLEPQPFRKTEMKLNEDGSYKGFELEGGVFVDADKSWWLAIDPTATEPHGRSRYLGAPQKTWKRRQDVVALRDLYAQRFALRGGVAHAPATDVDEKGNEVDVFAEIEKAYSDVQAGGMMLLPNTRDKDGRYLFDFTEAKLESFSADPIQSILDSMDQEQLLTFGIPPKTVIEGDAVGAFALVSQQMLILYAVVEDILDQCIESYNTYCCDKVVDMNFDPSSKPQISVTYTKLTERPDDLAVEIVKAWLTMPQLSPLVVSGAVDVGKVFEMVGIAVSPDFEAKLLELKTLFGKPAAPAGGSFSLSNSFPFE